MMRVMADLAGRGMVFVDSLTSARSVAAATARSAGIPAASRDVFLDDDQSEAAIARQLAQLERIARTSGTAIAIGHPYPATLAVLDRWIPQARARGVRFVTGEQRHRDPQLRHLDQRPFRRVHRACCRAAVPGPRAPDLSRLAPGRQLRLAKRTASSAALTSAFALFRVS